MNAQGNIATALEHYNMFNKRDIGEAAAEIVTDDLEWLSVPFGVTFRGHEGYKQFVEGWASAMPDSTVEVTNIAASGDYVATEFTGRGTQTGPFVSPAGTIPPTNRPVELSFCEVLQFQNGRIIRAHTYFDAATLMRQLGLIS